MVYSQKCTAESFWDSSQNILKCVRCEHRFGIHKGFEFTPNCGRDDYGGQPARQYQKCIDGTFNDGTFVRCRTCSSCPAAQLTAAGCNTSTDSQCCEIGEQIVDGECRSPPTTPQPTVTVTQPQPTVAVTQPQPTVAVTQPQPTVAVTQPQPTVAVTQPQPTVGVTQSSKSSTISTVVSSYSTVSSTSQYQPDTSASHHQTAWVVLAVILILSACALLFRYIIKKRRRQRFSNIGERRDPCCKASLSGCLPHENGSQSRSSGKKTAGIEEVTLLHSNSRNWDDLLLPELQGAPLQAVLDNLDVLENLLILLDPDSSGAKNTRHLAAHCSFSSTWINYAYSMRDSKSPLIAVLEGVTTRSPDWTVGHLARLLSDIHRNDAVAVLAKLPLPKEMV